MGLLPGVGELLDQTSTSLGALVVRTIQKLQKREIPAVRTNSMAARLRGGYRLPRLDRDYDGIGENLN